MTSYNRGLLVGWNGGVGGGKGGRRKVLLGGRAPLGRKAPLGRRAPLYGRVAF